MTVQRIDLGEPESGASAAEYALLVAGVAALIVIVVFAFGGLVRNLNHDNCTTIAGTASPSYDCGP
jgi:pilus assembly protein Flp/PilA